MASTGKERRHAPDDPPALSQFDSRSLVVVVPQGWMLGWARGGVAKIVQAHTHAPWLPHPCPGLSQAPANGKRFLEAGGGLRRASPSTGLMESLQAILAQFSHNAASPAQAARGRVIEGHSFLLSRSHGPRPGAPRPKQADLARAPSPGSGLTVLSQCAPAQLMRLDCDGQCDPNEPPHTPLPL